MKAVYFWFVSLTCGIYALVSGFYGENVTNISPQELNALQDLFDSTQGADWKWGPNDVYWNFSAPDPNPCVDLWEGIFCSTFLQKNMSAFYIDEIYLNNFGLKGTLPNSLVNLTEVQTLQFSSNALSGSIPESFVNISKLVSFYVNNNNFMTGIIPHGFIDLPLKFVSFAANLFHGPIPPFGSNSTLLQTFNLYRNQFTGTLSESFGNLNYLAYFEINHNQLSGTIPQRLSLLTQLANLDFWYNSFTGELPIFSDSQRLYAYDVSFNHFTGTLSPSIGMCREIIYMFLDSNILTGTLPGELTNITSLEVLSAFTNLFHGPLDHVFNDTTQPYMDFIDISDNQFSGTLPESMFSAHGVSSISASKNCLHGSIPLSVCSLKFLSILSLDGLQTASTCRLSFFPTHWEVPTYAIKHRTPGGIPSCLFELPTLFSVHLSGNGLEGPILSNSSAKLGPNLADLTLSFNSLTGTIPLQFQQHHWQILDLSNNRIKGSLSSQFARFNSTNQTLALQVNRISGVVPNSLRDARDIQILESNLFTCSIGDKELPTHDSYVHKYTCGSKSFDYSAYLWLSGLFWFTVLVLALVKFRAVGGTQRTLFMLDKTVQSDDSALIDKQSFIQEFRQNMALWLSVFNDEVNLMDEVLDGDRFTLRLYQFKFEHPVLANFKHVTYIKQYNALFMMLYILCVAMPLWALLTHYYSTYTHEYAWVISAVFLSGDVSCIVISFVVLGIVGITVNFHRYHKTMIIKHITPNNSQKLTTGVSFISLWPAYFSLLLIVVFNISVVLGVNVIYIYALTSQSREVVFVLQMGVAVFKHVWNSMVVPALMRWLYAVLAGVVQDTSKDDFGPNKARFVKRLTVELFLVLFNNLAATFIASALLNHSCFYYVITPPDTQVPLSCSQFEPINGVDVACIVYDLSDQAAKSYIPPFTYNFQCSSAIITSFANIYVYMFLVNTFIDPFVVLTIKGLYQWSQQHAKDSVLYWLTKNFLPRLLRPTGDLIRSYAKHVDAVPVPMTFTRALSLLFFPEVDRESLFDGHQFAVQILQTYSIILTFGVVVPPLAVFGFLAMLSRTTYIKLMVGRFICVCLHKSEHQKELQHLLEILAGDMGRLSTIITASEWVALPFIFVFYASLLFDTLGDQIGWRRAIFLPVLMCGIPLVVRAYVVLSRVFCPQCAVAQHAAVVRAVNYSTDDNKL